ncbi:hypothetical protein Pmani_009283 [Petrolisthes manimaculis]|uniref:MI domain-containing protein n=1 Tax=Petrolisthes manimaculis TaxID=1843537 RepID=A0AAE1Q545_9EUCA|nr:hypothetical protein Pmani_009283 [Petrolisthes manimaculis]
MKFKKTKGGRGKPGQSQSPGFRTKVKGRKELRKQKRQLKKQNRASFAAAKKKVQPKNESVPNQPKSNASKIKQLQAFAEAEKQKLKQSATKNNVSVKGKKKVTFQACLDSNEKETGGFQQASTSNSDRLARLQEFVNREAGKIQENKSSKKGEKKVDTSKSGDGKVKPNQIKDEVRLNALREDKEKDAREIKKLAKLLGFRKPQQTKKIDPDFENEFGSLLEDIELETMANSEKYEVDEDTRLNSEDELEKDMALALGQEPKKKKKKSKQKNDNNFGDSMGNDFDEFENGLGGEDEESDEDVDKYGEMEEEDGAEYGEMEEEDGAEYGEMEEEDVDEYGEIEEEDVAEYVEMEEEDGDEYGEIEEEDGAEYGEIEEEDGDEYGEMEEEGTDEIEEGKRDLKENIVDGSEDEQASEPRTKNRKYLSKENCHKDDDEDEVEGDDSDKDKEDREEEGDDSDKHEEDSEEEGDGSDKDKEDSEEEEEDGSDREEDGFLDFEAAEDSMEESEDDGELVHDVRKEEEYAFEGGCGYYSKPEILKNGQENDIDRYSSNSDDDEDLDDFVVDDGEVEYEDVSDELPDELSDSPSPLPKKRRRVLVESDDEEDSNVIEKNGENKDDVVLDSNDESNENICLVPRKKRKIEWKKKGNPKNKKIVITSDDESETINSDSDNQKYSNISREENSDSMALDEKVPLPLKKNKVGRGLPKKNVPTNETDDDDDDSLNTDSDNCSDNKLTTDARKKKLKSKKKNERKSISLKRMLILSESDDSENEIKDDESSNSLTLCDEDSVHSVQKNQNQMKNNETGNPDTQEDNNNYMKIENNEVQLVPKRKLKKKQLAIGSPGDSDGIASNSNHPKDNKSNIKESNDDVLVVYDDDNINSIPRKKTVNRNQNRESMVLKQLPIISSDDEGDSVGDIDTQNESDVTETEYGEFSECEEETEEEPSTSNNGDRRDIEETELKEDIYGRLRDKDGNIVSSERGEAPSGGRYVPPALRKLMALNMDEKKKEQLANIKKSLKGLLNRLAESNLGGIVNQIEGMYLKYSRNDMNETLTSLLMDSLIAPTPTPERLMQEHALLIAVLSTNVGNEVGAHILNEFVLKWNDDVSKVEEVESKELDNLLLFIANLYNFRVMDAQLLYDILNKLAHGFSGKEVELILLVLRSVGFTLRKDDPLALKSLITKIQNKATECQLSEDGDSEFSRVRFMLEVVQAIRNNNMAKVPNYDPSHSEHLKKILKGFLHKGTQSSPLNVSLEDLLKSRECGRWWIVGSAWSGGPLPGEKPPQKNSNPIQQKNLEMEFSEKFKEKAAKLHLSRPPRINILYAITEGSEDYLDAFEKVLQLNLPVSQERDLFSVILLCGQKGKAYNPFFAHLTNRMCKFDKKYKRLLQFALWDKFQEIESIKPREVANLAKYLTYLIGEDSLNLYIFKQISFMEAESQMISFLRQVLIGLLLHPSGSDTVQRVFSGLSASPKLQVLRQSLRIFILKFLKPKKNVENSDHVMLSKRIKEVTEILSRGGGISL